MAVSNAALSVRNYRRTLDVARACYLDADHPSLLVAALGSAPLGLLPLGTRRGIFRNLVKVAMMPLSSLEGTAPSLHADRVAANVGGVLGGGGGLPLVFPGYELGFSYEGDEQADSDGGREDDAAGYVPTLRGGGRLPHVPVELGWTAPGSPPVSLTGIAAEVRRELARRDGAGGGPPPFVLLLVGGPSSADDCPRRHSRVRVRIGSAHEADAAVVRVVPSRDSPAAGTGTTHVVDAGGALLDVARKDADDGVLVRPDGHVVGRSGYEVIGPAVRGHGPYNLIHNQAEFG